MISSASSEYTEQHAAQLMIRLRHLNAEIGLALNVRNSIVLPIFSIEVPLAIVLARTCTPQFAKTSSNSSGSH